MSILKSSDVDKSFKNNEVTKRLIDKKLHKFFNPIK